MSITKITELSAAGGAARRRRKGEFKKIGRYLFARPLMALISAVLLLTALIFGGRYYLHACSHELTDDAFIDAYITQIGSKVSSHVAQVQVKDNQHVNAGDLLVELDPSDFEARLVEARAALEAAEAKHRAAQASVEQTRITARGNVAEASSGVTAARAELDIAHAQVRAANDRERQAQAAIEAAQAQFNAVAAEAGRADADAWRYQRLYEQGMTSRQQWDQAAAATQTANARLAAARAQVEVARAGAATAASEVPGRPGERPSDRNRGLASAGQRRARAGNLSL